MNQQKKCTKSKDIIQTNVGVAALGDPHHNGITLISLVITVVVLLILAGVAISIVVSPEGLFTKSEQAKTDWNAKVDEEQIKIDEALGYLGIDPPVELPTGWDSSKVAAVVTQESALHEGEEAKVRNVPIPVGYTASEISTEDEIKEGLVIYQTDTAVTGEPNSEEHIAAMEGINQYVWIPVDDINDMVMCKHNNITEGSYEENGEIITTTTCKLEYDVSTNKITCKTHGYDTTVTLSDDEDSPNFIDTTGLAGRLYGMSATTNNTTTPKIYQTNMDFTDTAKIAHKFVANSTSEDSIYREPDLVISNDNSNYQLVLKESSTQALTSANELKHQLNNKFIEMAKSIAKYGGFYISRFEPSYENSKVISKKNKSVFTAATSASGNYLAGERWYGLYNKTLNNTEKEESVNSHMIWGCQYDQVIKFLGPQKGETGHTYQTKTQEKTGYDRVDDTGNPIIDQDILNNIYDFEGNNKEWTAQAYHTYYRVVRGGCSGYYYARDAYFFPASYRNINNSTDAAPDLTTRPTLYVAL